jgi:protein-S-isoprenylcysteine O-methyltransferase Ste14
MEKKRRPVLRWLKSTSNRTFIVYPLAIFGIEAALQQVFPQLNLWAMPLLLCGYLQYRLVGQYRLTLGGGGPGMSTPPERLVTVGPYRYTRNPMYLAHLIFMLGLALVFRSWAGFALLAFHIIWFQRRVCSDEAHLADLFGESYRLYHRTVKRWIPWLI